MSLLASSSAPNGHRDEVVKDPKSTDNGRDIGRARDPEVRSLPPFNRLPVRSGAFGYLALLSSERERAVLSGEVKGGAIGRIDAEILDTLNGETPSSMAKILLTSEERTQVKIDKALCALSSLIEDLAATRGTLDWLARRGKDPYTPAYPPELGQSDLLSLRERIAEELPE